MKMRAEKIRNRFVSPGQRERERSRRRFRLRSIRGRAENNSGASAVEFALFLPVLLMLGFAIMKFGFVFYDYIQLTNAVENGARQASAERGATTPLTATKAAVLAGAPVLTSSSVVITMLVNGTACASDSACEAALTANSEATIQATYPCNIDVLWITFSSCTVTSKASELVQ